MRATGKIHLFVFDFITIILCEVHREDFRLKKNLLPKEKDFWRRAAFQNTKRKM